MRTRGTQRDAHAWSRSHQKCHGWGNPTAAAPLPRYFQLGVQPSSQTTPGEGVFLSIPSHAVSAHPHPGPTLPVSRLRPHGAKGMCPRSSSPLAPNSIKTQRWHHSPRARSASGHHLLKPPEGEKEAEDLTLGGILPGAPVGAEPSQAGAGRARAQRAACLIAPLLNAPSWDE